MNPLHGSTQLTPRELQVLELLLRGGADKDIANELQLSLRAARFHVQNTLKKYQVHTRAELLAWHLENRQ
jgi:DNA-binding NarL/FixJ family response regulator